MICGIAQRYFHGLATKLYDFSNRRGLGEMRLLMFSQGAVVSRAVEVVGVRHGSDRPFIPSPKWKVAARPVLQLLARSYQVGRSLPYPNSDSRSWLLPFCWSSSLLDARSNSCLQHFEKYRR